MNIKIYNQLKELKSLKFFNETPSKVIKAFLKEYGISKKKLDTIYQNLINSNIQVKKAI